jgi:hypothetical protein
LGYEPNHHGIDKAVLFNIICSSPPEHLKMVNAKYVARAGHSPARSMKKELRGNAEKACKHALNMILKPEETDAIFIESTMKGIGTQENKLTAAILMYEAL